MYNTTVPHTLSCGYMNNTACRTQEKEEGEEEEEEEEEDYMSDAFLRLVPPAHTSTTSTSEWSAPQRKRKREASRGGSLEARRVQRLEEGLNTPLSEHSKGTYTDTDTNTDTHDSYCYCLPCCAVLVGFHMLRAMGYRYAACSPCIDCMQRHTEGHSSSM